VTHTFAVPPGWYEPPTEPDDNAWRYVRCPQCGTVVAHQPIPDDEKHCPCWEIYDDEYGVGYRDDCPCPCHEGDE
jgi:hypothetical protein